MLSGVRTSTDLSIRSCPSTPFAALTPLRMTNIWARQQACSGASTDRLSMQQAAFIERRQPTWERLDALIGLATNRGVRAMDAADVGEIGRLYRATTSDLAYARGREFDRSLTEYLNRLTARAHACVYGGSSESGGARIARFFVQTFPAEFRRSFAYFAICTALDRKSVV